jgi:hypothetical protein
MHWFLPLVCSIYWFLHVSLVAFIIRELLRSFWVTWNTNRKVGISYNVWLCGLCAGVSWFRLLCFPAECICSQLWSTTDGTMLLCSRHLVMDLVNFFCIFFKYAVFCGSAQITVCLYPNEKCRNKWKILYFTSTASSLYSTRCWEINFTSFFATFIT